MSIDIDINSLHYIILNQHFTNSTFKTNWISFRNFMDQYERDHKFYITRNLPHLLLDFYWQSYNRIKNLNILFNNYEINIINCSDPNFKQNKINNYNISSIIIYNVKRFINILLNKNLQNILNVKNMINKINSSCDNIID